MRKVILRLTAEQHNSLSKHLLPRDGAEAAALLLCGRYQGADRQCLTAHRVVMVPYKQCIRAPARLIWSTDVMLPLISEIIQNNLGVVKVHSHPGGFSRFSYADDAADGNLFASVTGWCLNSDPHASTIMLPDGKMFGRVFDSTGRCIPLDCVAVIGDELRYWPHGSTGLTGRFADSHLQAFGEKTTAMLRCLSIAVVGCSGTGSPTVEMLARLGTGRLVLVDPDRIEDINLNRIYNSTGDDAAQHRPKVEVLARAISAMDLGTEVIVLQQNVFSETAVRIIAGCDVIFGCVDSYDARYLLNKLATFYSIPYFDVGVTLQADGRGGIDKIAGSVHYLQPGGSSLLSRGVLTMEKVRAAGLKRIAPKQYAKLRKSKYIQGVDEKRPAVISINTEFAAKAVNEFLARLHPFRSAENANYAWRTVSLTDDVMLNEGDGLPCQILAPHVGRGDVNPLLDMPELS